MKTVALYVGHGTSTNGTWDCGCTYKNYTEAALMLPITQWAVKYLENSGVKVLTDAFKGNNMNLIKQVKEANTKNADLFISVHCDWQKAPSGVFPLYISAKGKELGEALCFSIMQNVNIKKRGIVKRTDLGELKQTNMVACILETGSIKADLAILRDCPKPYGKGIAEGICRFLNVEFKDIDEAPAKPAKPASTKKATKIAVDGIWGKETTKMTARILGLAETDTIKGQLKSCQKYLSHCHISSWKFSTVSVSGSPIIKALQGLVGAKKDGKAGKETVLAMQKFLKEKNIYKGSLDGYCGKATAMAWQKYINKNI